MKYILFLLTFFTAFTAPPLEEHISFSKEGPNTVGYIKIGDHESQISQATWIYVKSALDYYIKNRPDFIILELNTPGGEVFAAQKISDALKNLDTHHSIPVVTVIDNWAVSAGAMLAYSTRYIATAKDGIMGAAEPIMLGQGGKMEKASEKVNSALRADFAGRARFFDRNPLIAEAMVDSDLILVLRNGKITKLDKEEQIESGDELITAKGKLLTLDAQEMIDLGVADIFLKPEKLTPITEEEKAVGKWPAKKELLFTHPYFSAIPNATIDEYQMDWKTLFFVLLANPIVASLLSLGMIMGFYIEINTPGFGVPGGIALLCLFLIVLSSFALDIGGWLEVILLAAGLVLIALDLFVIPSFGIIGIVGIVLFLVGFFGLMLPGIGSIDYEFDTGTFNAAGEMFINRLAWLSGTMVVAFVLIVLLARYVMPTFSGFTRFVLAGAEQEHYIAGESPEKLPKPGTSGEVMATLRPAGKVVIDDQVFDALAEEGSWIERGEKIVVKKLDGSVLIVGKENT